MFDSITQSPGATLFCLIVGAVFILIEATPMLPTFGLSGALGIALAWFGIAGVAEQDLTWWPLVLAGLGGIAFEVLILVRRRSILPFSLASAAVVGGTLWTAALSKNLGAIAVAIGASVAVPAVAWWLIGAVQRLMNAQPQTGASALIGRSVQVEDWNGTSGAVSIDGARWNARTEDDREVEVGSHATVTAVDGLRLTISINN